MKILLTLFEATIHTAFAQDAWGIYCEALGTACGSGKMYIADLAVRTINAIIFPLVGGVAVIAILWASVKMTTDRGSDQGKEDAKKIIQYAVIGVMFSITGYSVVKWVCEMIQTSTGGSGYCV